MKPIWFLDIDGVINSVGLPTRRHGVDPADYSQTIACTGSGVSEVDWPITFSATVVAFVNDMQRTGLADVRWLTTWQQDARTNFAPRLGLDEFAAYDWPDDGEISAHPGEAPAFLWWKEQVVRDVLATCDQRFVWTDDDLDESVQRRVEHDFPGRGLYLQPAMVPGLSPAELVRIREFLQC